MSSINSVHARYAAQAGNAETADEAGIAQTAGNALRLGGEYDGFYRDVSVWQSNPDPNECLMPNFVSIHANGPDSVTYWYYTQHFWQVVSINTNVSQYAMSFNGSDVRVAVRRRVDMVWSDWLFLTGIADQIADTPVGDVGSYAMLGTAAPMVVTAGSIYAGSLLRYSGTVSTSTISDNTAMDIRGATPLGTWRACGSTEYPGRHSATLFLRIA